MSAVLTAEYTARESDRKRLERRLASLKTERSSFDAHARDLAENFTPRRGRFSLSETNRGDKRHQRIIDSTPLIARRTMQSGMSSGLTSPARPWFRLTTPDPALAEFASVKDWLHIAETRMRVLFQRTNLYTSLPEAYGEIGTFGTEAMLMLPDPNKVVRFLTFTFGQYWIAQDEYGRVDTLARELRMTVRQAVAEFGYAACSARVRTDWDRSNYDNAVDVAHLVEPNLDRMPGRAGPDGMAFRSCYWELGANDAKSGLLARRGFRTNPILAARWSLVPGDTYGTSCPGMDCLGDARALQFQQKRKAQAIDKWVDPPLQAPTSLKNMVINGVPGGVTYVDVTQSQGGVRPVHEWKPDIQYLLQDLGELRDRINQSWFADLFLMLDNLDRAQITATEVAERKEEKLLALGPTLERLNAEKFDPLIDGVFERMVEQSEPIWRGIIDGSPMLPPPPPELEGVPLRVEYISVLAQAQRLVSLGGIERFASFIGNLAAVKPDILDKLDADQAADEVATALGVPPGIVHSDDEVAQVRADRAQQQNMMTAAAAAQQGAAVAKDLGGIPADSPVMDSLQQALNLSGAG